MIYVIGAGGVGSWLCPSLILLTNPENITVVDGDKLEAKNLNRQLFTPEQVGCYKSTALASLYRCNAIADWYNFGSIAHTPDDWLFGCVDNHPARLAVIKACDRFKCRAIIAANETHSAEAYLYDPEWRDSRRDPRVLDQSMLTDTAGDPQRAAMGCTGEAQRANRQLVSANFMAAGLAQHLFVLWHMEVPKMDRAVIPHLPRKLVANLSALETHKVGTDEIPA